MSGKKFDYGGRLCSTHSCGCLDVGMVLKHDEYLDTYTLEFSWLCKFVAFVSICCGLPCPVLRFPLSLRGRRN